ncbi:hypothetical protein EXN51_27630 [Agrobacterium fabrum]|uniref:Uncharacterized protein n=1 Tax=Agrobacterium fabrum (strain C58 / ATCC 33970) TaxID=176299 RepID=A9CLB6_AGRFC|nr:conserved hypothetical protein [Agrobacterium fabrum str. C58]TRB21153.1 hypothetical protein EXN51_27630 [Agrobacterium fabrum]
MNGCSIPLKAKFRSGCRLLRLRPKAAHQNQLDSIVDRMMKDKIELYQKLNMPHLRTR